MQKSVCNLVGVDNLKAAAIQCIIVCILSYLQYLFTNVSSPPSLH